jgi:hypothetical protein
MTTFFYTQRRAASHPSPLVRSKARRALHRLSAEERTKREAGKP